MNKQYRKLTDLIDKVMGKVDYAVVGKMCRIFTYEHVTKCVHSFPVHKLDKMKPVAKSHYLFAMCRNTATDEDFIHDKNSIIDDTEFSL